MLLGGDDEGDRRIMGTENVNGNIVYREAETAWDRDQIGTGQKTGGKNIS